jgi:predicted phosphoribosyltransferase
MATGYTMLATIRSVREKGARKIIIAVPIASKDAIGKIEDEADEVFCLYTPDAFFSVGEFYDKFLQVEDTEVLKIIESKN